MTVSSGFCLIVFAIMLCQHAVTVLRQRSRIKNKKCSCALLFLFKPFFCSCALCFCSDFDLNERKRRFPTLTGFSSHTQLFLSRFSDAKKRDRAGVHRRRSRRRSVETARRG